MSFDYDIAIIGGGPAGSTAGTILRKYNPSLRVAIFEKEKFPREHVGESQLPAIGVYLHEMGVWDKVEAANFPIKVGATYRWGKSPDLWDFEFLTLSRLPTTARPHKYEGPRRQTAFQVDRAVYDTILLDHAKELGCEVFQETRVDKVHREGDRVTGLEVAGGRRVTARYYLDASGHLGILRRALGVGAQVPTKLMNIAMWDYWENAEWAVEIGVGGTRVQILSLDNGWMWFIPLGPTRTSIGFICPVEYYKACGRTPADLYADAIGREPRVRALTANATREGEVRTTKDWSFVADRVVGENWFLIGESAGFADPILAGGLTLTHSGAREAAYVILELDRGSHDARWLRTNYDETQRKRIAQYIRFADFWYAFNGQFTDLQGITAEIAKDAGLSMTPAQAFRWLSFGGFSHEEFALPGLGGLDLLAVKEVARMCTDEQFSWELNKFNTFKMNLLGATQEMKPIYHAGGIHKVKAYTRGGKLLVLAGVYGIVADVLKRESGIQEIARAFMDQAREASASGLSSFNADQLMNTLESMLVDGWVAGKIDPKRKKLTYLPFGPDGTLSNFHPNRDEIKTNGA